MPGLHFFNAFRTQIVERDLEHTFLISKNHNTAGITPPLQENSATRFLMN